MNSDPSDQSYNTQDDHNDDETRAAPLTYEAIRERNRRMRLQHQPETGIWSNQPRTIQAPTATDLYPSEPFGSEPAAEDVNHPGLGPRSDLTQEDIRLLRQCNKEGFYKRCKFYINITYRISDYISYASPSINDIGFRCPGFQI